VRPAFALLAALVFATRAFSTPAPTSSPFAEWAVVVVSGDDHAAHEDRPTAAFDNARRDVAAELERRGVSAANLAQVSVRDHGPDGEVGVVRARLLALAGRARAGCLLYVTSHGSPDGVLIGDDLVAPRPFARMVHEACAGRPTAVVLSACYSGVFVPALSAALGRDGFVFTAARSDRSSFGCGEDDRYPFFDGCVIQALPAVVDFLQLADRVRRCVSRREDETGSRPRSQPQLFLGSRFKADVGVFPKAVGAN
jgi:hypothetical protein